MLTTAAMIGWVSFRKPDGERAAAQHETRGPREAHYRPATGVDIDIAGALLKQAGNDVKTAIVMARLGISKDDAERRLREAGGRVSRALKG